MKLENYSTHIFERLLFFENLINLNYSSVVDNSNFSCSNEILLNEFADKYPVINLSIYNSGFEYNFLKTMLWLCSSSLKERSTFLFKIKKYEDEKTLLLNSNICIISNLLYDVELKKFVNEQEISIFLRKNNTQTFDINFLERKIKRKYE